MSYYEPETAGQPERVQKIPISDLKPFRNHPFRVVDDESMLRTTESISMFGVLTPLLARPLSDGSLEIISGHRRARAAEVAGLTEVPVIVRKMTDDEAVVLMVDSNLQRENILPSERAFAYKMKLEAMKRQGERTDLTEERTSRQVVGKLEAADVLGQDTGESGRQVQRFIRLTNLIPELLEMVDQRQISFNPAVELSYLKPEEQKNLIEAMDFTQAAPSLSQAMRLKKLSQEGNCSLDDKYAGKTPAQHRQRSVSLIIDIQKKCQEKGPGYQQWAKVHNVKQLAQSVYLMRERGCRTISELSVRADDQIKKRDDLLASIKASEARMAEIATLKKHIINYSKTRKTYEEYRKAGYSKKFFEAHREEITLHKAAKQAFDDLGVKKIPKVKDLNTEYAELLAKKKAAYPEYRRIKEDAQELLIAKMNIESFYEADQKVSQEHQRQEKQH